MKRRLTFLAFTALTVMAIFSIALAVPSPAGAGGATQISGIAYSDAAGDCADPEGAGSDFAAVLTGDLEGCLYIFVESAKCSPSGAYQETGTETFVGQDGTFRTNYRFEAKFQDCANLAVEIHGRCQHPIIAGSGTGLFEGVTGRIDFKDDIEAGNFPYRGHLK
jgi:hypothetical protein